MASRTSTSESESSSSPSSPESGESSRSPSPEPESSSQQSAGSQSQEESDSSLPPSLTRQRNTHVNYKEDDTDNEDQESVDDLLDKDETEIEPEDPVDTIERVMDIRQGRKGATGSGTTIYAVEENADPNETLPEDSEMETQFFIKWAKLSHLHNTWESLETLKERNAKGLKKVDNFCKKEDELNRWRRVASVEDIEYSECQLELQQELAKSYTQAERIIAEHRADTNEIEYYVKWDCLPYVEATWESGQLITRRNPEVIDTYRRRESSNKTPSGSKSMKSRPKFSQIKVQPNYMMGDDCKLVLRDYQLDGVNWLIHSWCKENSVILADEMGLGKTIQSICFLSYLFEIQNVYGPFLLVVPLSTMTAWQKEFRQWAPQINVVTYLGDVPSRDIIREYEWYWYYKSYNTKLKFNALLTTYEIVLKDKHFLESVSWAVLMVDEAHRLKNGDSLLYKTLQEFNTNHRVLITGTPLQNSLKELWCLLHFIMPHKFDEWESFEHEHDNAAHKGYDKLHKQLEPFILRRVKKDVEKSLPSKVEQILRVDMTSLQKQYYKWILTKNYNALRKGVKGSISSFVNVVMELKKCCNHAMLVKPEENGNESVIHLLKGSGKLMLLDKLLVRLKETGHRVLIFSQMVRMLDIIAEYLQQRRFAFQRLDGSIKGDLRKQALEHFNAEGSQDFCFLLSTRAGGLGINLATADTVIIFDSDWNPQNDLQAQARAHRIGQKNQVNIYRLVTKASVEEEIVERAKRKMVLDHLVIQRMDTTGRTVLDKGSKSGTPFNKEELNAILKFGAEELFKEDVNETDDICDIDEILKRAETNEEPGERPGDELLSAFKSVTFAVTEEEAKLEQQPQLKEWDNIIPTDIRTKMEAEEKEKEMAGLYLPPRSRTAAAESNGNTANNKDALRKIKRKRKREARSDDESESDSGKPKKRGRPKAGRGKGFSDNQIRKFIKSFKRFPKPLLRMDLIAKDCGLTEKSAPELRKLGEQLILGCQAAMADARTNLTNGPVHIKEEVPSEASIGPDGKKKGPSPTFKIAGINVNARTLSSALEELEPLGQLMPKDVEARKVWRLSIKTKVPSYDVDWGSDEDTRLLHGVWEHGTGAWDTIRNADPILKEKVFLETEKEKKPQLKHIQTRAEYLFKVLRKHLAITQAQAMKGKKGRHKHAKIENGAGLLDAVAGGKLTAPKKERKPRQPKEKISKKNLTPETGIDPVVFNECKEKMRPVKHALKSLDNPDLTLPETEQLESAKRCLIAIGDHIKNCLKQYRKESEQKEWKGHLWSFVAQFTEYEASKLHKLYKRALKKESDKRDSADEARTERPRDNRDRRHHHHHHDHHLSPVKKEFDGKRDVGNVAQDANSNIPPPQSSPHSKPPNYERDLHRERFARRMGEYVSPSRSNQNSSGYVPPPPRSNFNAQGSYQNNDGGRQGSFQGHAGGSGSHQGVKQDYPQHHQNYSYRGGSGPGGDHRRNDRPYDPRMHKQWRGDRDNRESFDRDKERQGGGRPWGNGPNHHWNR